MIPSRMITFVLFLTCVDIAQAVCVQADGAGTWRFFTTTSQVIGSSGVSFNASRGYAAFSATGVLTSGSITQTGVNVSTNIVSATAPIAANSGRITLQPSCRAFGCIMIGGVRNNIEGWMTRDKGSIAGIGWFDTTTTPNVGSAGTFSIDLVKQ